MNNIIKILNIEDEDILILDVRHEGDTKFIEIEKVLKPVYCPCCGSIMHSKGTYTRRINNSMLIDGFKLVVVAHERKWRCQNSECNHYMYDKFIFVDRYKRQANFIPVMILNSMKDPNLTVAEVARMYHVSDTYVHDTFMSYVDPKRLPLPEVLSIDEVFLDIDSKTKFSCMLIDFETRDLVDILQNRWKVTLDKYFYSISLEEREKVKFIICDMYDEYVKMPENYFPNAETIVDSFHVISNLNNQLNGYINTVKRKYVERDRKALEEKNRKNNTNYKDMKKSTEVNILNHYSFFLLEDMDKIEYRVDLPYNSYLHYYATTRQIEDYFLGLDENFRTMRDLKQEYIQFNRKEFDKDEDVENELNQLIQKYKESGLQIFENFAQLLEKYKAPIIASFHYYTLSSGKRVRLSNGPMEGMNRRPKDMKRDARGFEVFAYIRARLLYCFRKVIPVPILGVPKRKDEIERSKRTYRKNKKTIK